MGRRGASGDGAAVIAKAANKAALINRLTKMYAAGRSLRQIAAETGRSASAVHSVLTKNGVPLRPRGGRSR